jgi:hypothetical protein
MCRQGTLLAAALDENRAERAGVVNTRAARFNREEVFDEQVLDEQVFDEQG